MPGCHGPGPESCPPEAAPRPFRRKQTPPYRSYGPQASTSAVIYRPGLRRASAGPARSGEANLGILELGSGLDNMGASQAMQKDRRYDVVIIGAGPAGLTAALYAGRARVKTVVLERGAPAGELLKTEAIGANPGFGQLTGPERAQGMASQAAKF